MDFSAQGGGDGPESMNQALYDMVHKISWTQIPNAYKAIFLGGDAPPHMDYQDDTQYPQTIANAINLGIIVSIPSNAAAIQQRPPEWQQIAV